MKRLLLLVVLVVAGFVVYKYAIKKEDKADKSPTANALAVSAHSDAFNQSIKNILDAYYAMADGFVQWDSSLVNKNAVSLHVALEGLDLEELKQDTLIYETVTMPLENAKASVAAISEVDDWDTKRKQLQDLSENLRMLLITIKYDQGTVYWQECPMAFEDGRVGNWLSKEEKIANPYLGNQHPKYGATMIDCGETKETINFAENSK
ncbi:DUF3347 domain-containing protein [Niabella digestorum]|jgi:Protein of unknown function (DUF3347).|uniref:DUF3347 domain-containing protein n=1 Tax=Niabella digestorum TaxID=3117701 RepID=A0ABU7RHM6_9BACT